MANKADIKIREMKRGKVPKSRLKRTKRRVNASGDVFKKQEAELQKHLEKVNA